MKTPTFKLDPSGCSKLWRGVQPDLDALSRIVCEVFRVSLDTCGEPIRVDERAEDDESFARIYSFDLPDGRSIIARLIAPIRPFFKTEAEVAAMDFVRSRTTLPVPERYRYCSEADNPVGVEWVLMEKMPGITLSDAWELAEFGLAQKQKIATDLANVHVQLAQLRGSGCGSIYHSTRPVDDITLLSARRGASNGSLLRSLRWRPLSLHSLRKLRDHCNHPLGDGFALGPLNDSSMLNPGFSVPTLEQTRPVFTTSEFVQLLVCAGIPTSRSPFDSITSNKAVELFNGLQALYTTSKLFGPAADPSVFRFNHGDMHDENILVDPTTGAITGIIDWESAGFRPRWVKADTSTWFSEDIERFPFPQYDVTGFDDESQSEMKLRAMFRQFLHKGDADSFACFLGGNEFRAILDAGTHPDGYDGYFDSWLAVYVDFWKKNGVSYWSVARRGPFPFDLLPWFHEHLDLEELHQIQVDCSSSSRMESGAPVCLQWVTTHVSRDSVMGFRVVFPFPVCQNFHP